MSLPCPPDEKPTPFFTLQNSLEILPRAKVIEMLECRTFMREESPSNELCKVKPPRRATAEDFGMQEKQKHANNKK